MSTLDDFAENFTKQTRGAGEVLRQLGEALEKIAAPAKAQTWTITIDLDGPEREVLHFLGAEWVRRESADAHDPFQLEDDCDADD